ncbi:MAG: hypothetical protein AB7I33_11245 [Gemmatimonadales bacterium]
MKIKIFRWKAIGPLLLLLILLGVVWMIFGDRFVEDTSEEAATELLGTEVDVNGLRIRETDAAIDVARIQVADPFDSLRNLLEADSIVFDLDPAALLEKKLVIDRLTIRNLRTGTRRDRPARAAAPDGFAPALLRELKQWKSQFDVPILKLTPIDTLKQLVLNPDQLATVQAANRVVGAADSARQALEAGVNALALQPVLDSARTLAERLAGTSPARLGLAGTRDAVSDVRRTLASIDQARTRVNDLKRSGDAVVMRLQQGVAEVQAARQRDYDFARSLLQLPRFDAPNIAPALFGDVSIDRFQQAVYWAELVQRYLPPGLKPRERPGPKRLRRAGTDVAFPKEAEYPTFLLRQGDLGLTVGSATFSGEVTGLTTQPAIYGRPARLSAGGTVRGTHPVTLQLGAVIDHLKGTPDDSVQASVTGIPLPVIRIPQLPFSVDPGRGETGLMFRLNGDQVFGRWSITTSNAAWRMDSASVASLGSVGQLVWRVVSGVTTLDVTAELTGTLRAPRLAVRSNLDQAIAERLKAVVGEEVARAEARARARVDSLVSPRIAAAQEKAAAYREQVDSRVAEVNQRLDQAKADLETRLRALTGGIGGLKLPGS